MSLGFINKSEIVTLKTKEHVKVVQVPTKLEDEPYSAYFPKRTLYCFNLTLSIFHTAFMVVTLTAGNLDLSIPVYGSNITFQENSNGTIPRFELIPNYYKASSLYLTYIVAGFFACSALAHCGNALLWRPFYESQLSKCRVPTRWIEYFVSASIMILVIAFNAGIRGYLLLIAITMLMASTIPYGLLTELYSTPLSDTQWCESVFLRLLFHMLGYIPQLSAWGIILLNFYNDTGSDPPSFVYVIVWAQLGLFFSFGFVQFVQILRYPKYYYQGEIVYQILSLVSKGLLGSLLLFNVLVLGSFDEIFD